MSIFVKEKSDNVSSWMSNEYSFNMSKHPLSSEWLYLDPTRVCTSICQRQNLSAELYDRREGEKKIMFEAYNIVLEHFFLYNVTYIVYNPKLLKVKMKIIFVFFFWFVNGMDMYIWNETECCLLLLPHLDYIFIPWFDDEARE